MRVFEADNANEVWIAAAQLLFKGKDEQLSLQDSRCGHTRELLHACFVITNPSERWVVARTPALNPAFAMMEVLWILAGSRDAEVANAWNPKLPRYCGTDDVYAGAYGYRLRQQFGLDQLERASQALSSSP